MYSPPKSGDTISSAWGAAVEDALGSGKPAQWGNYVIYKSGGLYYARDGLTGERAYNKSSLLTLLDTVFATMTTAGGTVILKDLRKPANLTIPSNIRLCEYYAGQVRNYSSYGLIFEPIGTRTDATGIIYFDADKEEYCIYLTSSTLENKYYSLWTLGQTFSFGTYQWKAKLEGVAANQNYTMGLEFQHGRASAGIIALRCAGGTTPTYYSSTNWNGSGAETELSDQDWTTERTMKIVWTATSVKFYIDGTLVATHTTHIPQKPQCVYFEAYTGDTAPGETGVLHFRNFEEIP